MTTLPAEPGRSELLIYQTEDGKTRIEVRLENETVWLNQSQLCELFDKNKRTISEHIRNIFRDGELQENSVVRKFRTTAADGKNYTVTYYNKVFWRKALDIYASSIDYDPNTDISRQFFAVVQNKMHWAAHGHTAAEVIKDRADASKRNMGLTSWSGSRLSKSDIEIAKNYLNQEELEILNRIVTIYLDFAELQAFDRKPMYMRDWIVKLDEFLKLSNRELLDHAGTVSHEQAIEKANAEYEKYHALHINDPSPVERHFLEAVKEVKQLEKDSKPRATRKT